MPTDTEIVKSLAVGEISSALAGNANAYAEIAKLRTRFYPFYKTAADGAAATATAETAVSWNRVYATGKLTGLRLQSTAALTGDPANNAVILVSKRDAAGANKTTLGTITTTASWVAGTTVNIPITAANIALVAGGSITFEISKGGTGVIVPICTIVAEVEDT